MVHKWYNKLAATLEGLFVRTYQPAYQLESTVFFSHNKSASAGLSAGFNTSRTGTAVGESSNKLVV